MVYSVRAVERSVVRLPASWSLHRCQRRFAIKYCVFNLILFADKLYSISELFVSLCFESRRNTSCFLLTRSQPQFDLNTLRQKSKFCALSYGSCSFLNPLSPNGEQHQFSPNNIHTLSRKNVMKIYEMITKEQMLWSAIKFSQLILKGNVWRSVWRICMWILGLKVYKKNIRAREN